jgi:hypothetical protein
MPRQARLSTMILTIGAHPIMTNSSKLARIYGEINQIGIAERSGNSNWLLHVLHTTRALDTCLSEILTAKGWNVGKKNLGTYFATLATHHVLRGNQNTYYTKTLANPRNKYMHEAGATPTMQEARTIFNEMYSCLDTVLQNT